MQALIIGLAALELARCIASTDAGRELLTPKPTPEGEEPTTPALVFSKVADPLEAAEDSITLARAETLAANDPGALRLQINDVAVLMPTWNTAIKCVWDRLDATHDAASAEQVAHKLEEAGYLFKSPDTEGQYFLRATPPEAIAAAVDAVTLDRELA